MSHVGHGFTSTGVILVLFILLVIVSRAFFILINAVRAVTGLGPST